MCGRVIQSSPLSRLAIVEGLDVHGGRFHNHPPRWNGAPSQELLVIRRNHHTGGISFDPPRWGLIPYWCEDAKGGRKPINAKCETVHTLPTFRDAYRRRRCILPVDGFFEWKAIKGQKTKQPFAISMTDGSPFGLGGLWENWKDPSSVGWVRTFAIITTNANELVAEIHDRIPRQRCLLCGSSDRIETILSVGLRRSDQLRERRILLRRRHLSLRTSYARTASFRDNSAPDSRPKLHPA